MKLDDDASMVSLDAANAFGSIDRSNTCEMCCDEIPEMVHWFVTLYREAIVVQFDARHKIRLVGVYIQGLTSSSFLHGKCRGRHQD